MHKFCRLFKENERGGTAIEYALIAGLMSMTIIISIISMGGDIVTIIGQVRDGLINAN